MLRQLVISCLIATIVLPAAARTRPHYGGTLRVEIEGDPWQRPNSLARRLTLDGLTRMDSDGVVHPSLAAAWRSENEDHRWEFRLRPGARFHDGSLVTSASVVTALSAACSASCPWTEIHAVGASVIFTGDSPMPSLPALLAGDEFLIAADVGGNIGTGPFQLNGFNNAVLTLTANERLLAGAALRGCGRNSRSSLHPRSVARPECRPRRSRRGSSRAVAPGSRAAAHRASIAAINAARALCFQLPARSAIPICAGQLRWPSIAARSPT